MVFQEFNSNETLRQELGVDLDDIESLGSLCRREVKEEYKETCNFIHKFKLLFSEIAYKKEHEHADFFLTFSTKDGEKIVDFAINYGSVPLSPERLQRAGVSLNSLIPYILREDVRECLFLKLSDHPH